MSFDSSSPFTPVSGEIIVDSSYTQEIDMAADSSRNWMGIAALIAGALLIFPAAITLGHLALSSVKTGTATNRPFALAGTILGYIGLVAVGGFAAAYVFVFGEPLEQGVNDANAQVDVTAVGREVALHWIDNNHPPTLVQGDTEYRVEDVTIVAALTTERTLTMIGNTPFEWCVTIAYEGGSHTAYSYTATEGVQEGAVCSEPLQPLPSVEPSPSPSAVPSPEVSGPAP